MDDTVRGYPSIYCAGHAALEPLYDGPVLVEEKVDGSQFSFCRRADGTLLCRSRGQQVHIDAPDSMFERACQTVKDLREELTVDYIYRGEYLSKPKHNTLKYARTPEKHIILFDIEIGYQAFLDASAKRLEAARLGLEVVPLLFEGVVQGGDPAQTMQALVPGLSILGGADREGVVVKNYARFGQDKKVLMGKYVSAAFQEVHAKEWKTANPSRGDILQQLVEQYRTEARWHKSVQRMRDAGQLTGTPRDIGTLLRMVPEDILTECEAEIKAALFAHAWPHIKRGSTAGFPEWYKSELNGESQTQET